MRRHSQLMVAFAVTIPMQAVAGPAATPQVATHVEMGPDVKGFVRTELPGHIRAGLERSTASIIDVSSADCPDVACVRQRSAEAGATHVLVVSVRREDPDYITTGKLLTVEGEEIASVSEACEICGQSELESTVADLVAVLSRRLNRISDRPARVRIAGDPAGTSVEIDGVSVGTTPYEGELDPGPHQVSLSAPGRATQVRELDLVEGVEERVEFSLAETPDAPEVRNAMRPAGWVLLAAGVASLGGGVTLWVLDGRNHGPTCEDAELDSNGACPNIYNTLPAGVGLTVGGVALAGTGATLLVVDAKRRKRAEVTARAGILGGTVKVRF